MDAACVQPGDDDDRCGHTEAHPSMDRDGLADTQKLVQRHFDRCVRESGDDQAEIDADSGQMVSGVMVVCCGCDFRWVL